MLYSNISLRFDCVFTASVKNIVALQQALLLDGAIADVLRSEAAARRIICIADKNKQKDIKYITAPQTSLLSGNFNMNIRYARQRFYHMRR